MDGIKKKKKREREDGGWRGEKQAEPLEEGLSVSLNLLSLLSLCPPLADSHHLPPLSQSYW